MKTKGSLRARILKTRPGVDMLEDRKLMSFGGGNIDYSIPRLPTTSPQLNFTSNSFHQINATVPSVAQSIVNNPTGYVAPLTTYVQHIPNGTSQLLPILKADLVTFRAGGSVTSAQATVALDSLYQQLLGRNVDAVGLSYNVPAMVHGTTVAQIADGIVTSTEFIGNNITAGNTGDQNQNQFVTALYEDVLGRSPDPGGLAYWVGEISSNTLTVQQVATDFVNSPEAATSSTSVLQTAALPTSSGSTYYFGSVVPGGPITGNFAGTSTLAQVENLIQNDTIAYLGNGIGSSFNILKSNVRWASDKLLTYNGRV